MRFHWHNLLHASGLGIDAPYQRWQVLWKLCCQGLCLAHMCFLGLGQYTLNVTVWVWNLTFLIAQSACVFSVNLRHWTMSEEKRASQTHLTTLPTGSLSMCTVQSVLNADVQRK